MSRLQIRRTDELDSAIEALTADGSTTSDVVRTAIALYHQMCRQAWALRDAGHPGGLIQCEYRADSGAFYPLPPLKGVST